MIIPLRSPSEVHGIAVGPYNSAQTLGGALGGGLFLSLLTVGHTAHGAITRTGYTTVWITSTAILALALVLLTTLLTDPAPARVEHATSSAQGT